MPAPHFLDPDENLILRTARKVYRCEGSGSIPPKLAASCTGRIEKGQRYVEYLGEVPDYSSGSRHCIACHNMTWKNYRVAL